MFVFIDLFIWTFMYMLFAAKNNIDRISVQILNDKKVKTLQFNVPYNLIVSMLQDKLPKTWCFLLTQ